MCKKNILKYRKISANEREARQRKCLFSLSNPTREQRDKRNCLRISTSRNVFFVQQKHYIRDGQNQKRVKNLKRKLFFESQDWCMNRRFVIWGFVAMGDRPDTLSLCIVKQALLLAVVPVFLLLQDSITKKKNSWG